MISFISLTLVACLIRCSFFIPEIEYLQDLTGLIKYLQEKVCDFHLCLQCNGRGRKFHSLRSVRQHMLEKGHVYLDGSENGSMEISEYYDFSSSYSDWEDVDECKSDDLELAHFRAVFCGCHAASV